MFATEHSLKITNNMFLQLYVFGITSSGEFILGGGGHSLLLHNMNVELLEGGTWYYLINMDIQSQNILIGYIFSVFDLLPLVLKFPHIEKEKEKS